MLVNGIDFAKHPDGYWIPKGDGFVENATQFAVTGNALGMVMVMEDVGSSAFIHAICPSEDYNNLASAFVKMRSKLSADNPGKKYSISLNPTKDALYSLGGLCYDGVQ